MDERKPQILVIVEGGKTDVQVMRQLFTIYGIDRSHEIVSYGTSIHNLYRQMFSDGHPEDYDLLQVLRARETDEERRRIFDRPYSDILLIFDLDPRDPTFTDGHIEEMMEYFCESSDMGRLYLNYPMVEAFYHMKSIPDPDYYERKVSLTDIPGGKYKDRVNKENRDHIYARYATNKAECDIIIRQNLTKGRMLANGFDSDPGSDVMSDDVVAIPDTNIILRRQLESIKTNQYVWVLATCVYYIPEYNPRLLKN